MVDWPHAPVHRFGDETTFFITGATYLKRPYYDTAQKLDSLRTLLFAKAKEHDCWLQAWALLSNHYHLVAHAENGEKIRRMLGRLHAEAAIELNRQDREKGRRVWYQFWDKTLTFEGSWLARLRYTHENAVHHGIVREATQYPWCSAAWFERSASKSFVATVRNIKIDAVKIYDDF